MSKTKRKYNFPLPYTVNYFYIALGLQQLKEEGIFNNLPVAIQNRFETAGWSGAVITKADCDSIDTETWTKIANRLGLDWEETV